MPPGDGRNILLKKIMMASLAVGALALNAPAAFAATDGGCGFDSVQQETATGQNYEGVAYGYAVDDTGGTVSIRCYITVNDVPAAAGSTPTETGTGVAVARGPISFEAADGASVKMCTEINGLTVDCGESTNTQIPPQEVIDAISSVADLICALPLGRGWGIPGILEITSDGRVLLFGQPIWDCPLLPPVARVVGR